jgi:hypothetical protein
MTVYQTFTVEGEPFLLSHPPDEHLKAKARILQAAREVVLESCFEQMSGDYIVSYREMKALIDAVKADPEEEA